jgi:hypothetical protein
MATVTIHIIDENGHSIEDCCLVDRFAGLDHVDISSHFQGLRGTQIPVGEYIYNLSRGARRTTGRISVYSPEVFAVIHASHELLTGASADGVYASRPAIRGKLEPMPTRKSEADPVWIRLSPTNASDRIDVLVDPSGDFRIYGWSYGRYVLSVIQGNDLLQVQPITIKDGASRQSLVVKLSSTPLDGITLGEEKRN